jgi:hypothetical protein
MLTLQTLNTADICWVAAFTVNTTATNWTLLVTGRFHLWDAECGAKLSVFESCGVTLADLWHINVGILTVSLTGPLVVAAVKFGAVDTNLRLGVWDCSTGEQLFSANHNRYGSLVLSPDTILFCAGLIYIYMCGILDHRRSGFV